MHADRAVDEAAERLVVDVVEALEVQAPLPHLVRPELLEQLRVALW